MLSNTVLDCDNKILGVRVKGDCTNKWTLDRWRFTFDVC